MKKYIIIILSAVAFVFSGCDSFLDRPQLDKVEDNEGNFWRNEADFRTYSVEFYPWFLTGYNTSYSLNYAPLRGYNFSDDVGTGTGQQTNFLASVPSTLAVKVEPEKLLEQSWHEQFAGEKWNFGWVRKANVLIQRVEEYKGNLSGEAYLHWLSVGRFFRAYAYYNLVISFGDVPYFDAPVDETQPDIMYKDRDDRGYVMDKVMEDLDFAMTNAYEQDNSSTQYVNKYLIAAIASRIMLFEGTWQKYHGLSAEKAKTYLQFCMKASEVLMNTGKYSCTKDFRSLFGSDNLAGHPEVIFYRHYAAAMAMHCVASYSNGDEGQQRSPNLQLLKSFICNDGQPYELSSLATANDFNLAEMAITRDPRFEATFFDFPLLKSQTMVYADKFISREGASYWNNVANRPSKFGGALNENDAPVVRYAEVLLNWIEAKAELAISYSGLAVIQDDIDLTINAIRDRPLDNVAIAKGVKKTAPLDIKALPDDPKRDADVSALLWEIRRERRMEFIFEHTRLLDIKRWKKIDYMSNTKYPDTMFGAWVNFPQDLPNYLTSENEGKLVVRKADGTEVTYNGSNAVDMVGFYKIKDVISRENFTDRVYLSPVGTQEIQDYSNNGGYTLTQTIGWR